MIDIVYDLDEMIADEKTWHEIKENWPKNLPKQIERKVAQLKANSLQSLIVDTHHHDVHGQYFVSKEAWIFHQSDYQELRKGEGHDKLVDLPAAD